MASRKEPGEAPESGRSPYLEIENEDRSLAQQMEEEETVQRPQIVRMAERPEEEPETLQPKMSADSHSMTEEDTGEMKISDREYSKGTAEPDPLRQGKGELGRGSYQKIGSP